MINSTSLSLGGLATADTQKSVTSGQKLSADFDNFLKLLTTQLRHQDPTNPMDSKEFTNQLVSFSQLEQQIQTNQNLGNLLQTNQASAVNAATNFIRRSVNYEGDKFSYEGEPTLDFSYLIKETALESRISILNEAGQVVFSTAGSPAAGEHAFAWDGKDSNGQPVPNGIYTFQVGARGTEDRAIQTSALVPARINGIEVVDGTVYLSANNLLIGIDSVLSVKK
jgi:flagellar basal-body rod modification protein FlgD